MMFRRMAPRGVIELGVKEECDVAWSRAKVARGSTVAISDRCGPDSRIAQCAVVARGGEATEDLGVDGLAVGAVAVGGEIEAIENAERFSLRRV